MKITIDPKGPTRPTDYSWQEGLGCDHAFQLHRSDMVDQLRFVHDELGIRSLRFHGIFDDDMWTISDLRAFAPMPGGGRVREVNFRQCGHVYDNLLKCGVKPFVELSFMPSQLASGSKTGLHYKNNTTPPRSWEEWGDYIRAFIRFLLDRYGEEVVESWWFEVWNEPDLKGGFFSGTQRDYFQLYEVTARAIKSVDPRIRVGGPSTSACKWIDEFLAYCRGNSVPLDFVSTHHYPGDAFGNAVTPANYGDIFKVMLDAVKTRAGLTDAMSGMFFSPERAARVPKGVLAGMDDELCAKAGSLPVFMTEWNSMAIFAAPVHDEKYSAAFVLKTVLDLDNRFTGYFFWCLSDLFEELLQLNGPFVGGYGILTNDGIPKPNFWAFKLLSRLYPQRLEAGFRANTPVEYAAFRDENSLQVLVFAQSNDPRERKHYEVELEIRGAAKAVTAERIDDGHCNPKRLWQEMGSPQNLTPAEVEDLKARSRLVSEPEAFTVTGGKTVFSCALDTNDIVLYTLEMQGEGETRL